MHKNSLRIMGHLLSLHSADHLQDVLDVGSFDVNGTYRPLCSHHGLEYTGADQVAGPNVDRIMGTFTDQFDLVISGQALEHRRNPFTLMQQICGHARHQASQRPHWPPSRHAVAPR